MELVMIATKSEIQKSQDLFVKNLKKEFGEPFQVKKINDITKHSVVWFEELQFWVDTERLIKKKNGVEENYFWNACGVVKPKGFNDELDITVQIGIDPEDSYKRAAVFLKDESKKTYLAHSGLVNKGGGKKRPQDKLTIQKYILKNIDMQEFEIKVILGKTLILIGCLESDNFKEKLARFVHQIHKLKKAYNAYLEN